MELNEPGFVLASGVTITGIQNGTSYNGFAIDVNGAAGPNVIAKDQFYMTYQTNSATIQTMLVPFGAETEGVFYQLF